jgi:hypothetical protein
LPGLRLAGHHHARLQQHVLERQAVAVQGNEHLMQDGLRDVGATRLRVVAVDQKCPPL